jgi:hypothetical protein
MESQPLHRSIEFIVVTVPWSGRCALSLTERLARVQFN